MRSEHGFEDKGVGSKLIEFRFRIYVAAEVWGITEREGHPAPPMPHLTEEAFLGLAANASEHGKHQKDSY